MYVRSQFFYNLARRLFYAHSTQVVAAAGGMVGDCKGAGRAFYLAAGAMERRRQLYYDGALHHYNCYAHTDLAHTSTT